MIFQEAKKILSKQIIIQGLVDEYEPETIWIEFKNVKKGDVKYLGELFSSFEYRNFRDLPQESGSDEINEKFFKQKVEKGLEQIREGKTISHEKVREMIKKF